MSCSRPTNVKDLSALSDAQLSDFMIKNRQPNGAFELPVDGWERLPKRERGHLAERLRSIQRAVADNSPANSRPLDLDKLDALLRDVSSREDFLPQDRSCSCDSERRTQTPDYDSRELYKQLEMEAYDNLVKDGGRPLYPIDMLELISQDPDAHHEMLGPFWRKRRFDNLTERDSFYPHDVLQRQWLRWQNFRKWQRDNRMMRIEDEDDGFLAFVEKSKRECMEVNDLKGVAEIEADPTCLKQPGEQWYHMQRHRKWQRRWQREHGCKSFSDYEEAVKARLARHGFTRPFHLTEDPKPQNKLTTWVEYLGFEYWWLDRYTKSFERLKLKHDNAWVEVKEQGMVKDDETPEFVRTDASGTRCQREEDRARKAVQDAESNAQNAYQKTQKDPNRLDIPKEQRVQMLVKARKRLSKAREALDFTKRRSHLLIKFVRETFDYDDAREDVANQRNLLEWVVAETRSIEDEQRAASDEQKAATEDKQRAATEKGVSRRKRKTKESTRDSCAAQPNSKRQKSNALKHGPKPSNDGTDVRCGGRDVASTDMDRQLGHEGNHIIPATYPDQTKLVGFAVQPVSLIEAEPEPVTLNGGSRKRKVAFENTSLTQSSPKRPRSNALGHGLQPSNKEVGTTSTRVSRVQNRSTGMSQQLDQHQTHSAEDTNFSSQSPGSNVPFRELTQGLRRSSRLGALRLGSEIHLAKRETNNSGNQGSKYLPVEKVLEKRIRRRGRGRITEYLVKFSGDNNSRSLWTTLQKCHGWL
ncbi:hypothetical protein QQS21_007258 [Conoideocrella luteorostrata]|uniref:Ankyrin 2,3/unc44 n=1 Tax=Conoideocrella luteorostrata TaxID=1105319 RepID=A0AAJ0FX61_9HYPO|nr:hypothetical protein QQS21_007258 [Conoideocrella luteorostrata]